MADTSASALYPEVSVLISAEGWLPWLGLFVGFLSPRHILGQYLEIYCDRFLPHPSEFTMENRPLNGQ
jgi:hypothetical protein